MIKLFRWLIGYVDFKYSGGFADEFINACYANNLAVHDIKIENGILYGNCTVNVYKHLHRLALKSSGTVYITKKHGILFLLLKYKNRVGLIIGILIFVLMLNYLGGFVWHIQIKGNNSISQSSITEFLSANNFGIGTRWDSVNKENIESMIMGSFDDCAWVSINKKGTTAVVEINETVVKPSITDKTITNLKATKDGVIVSEVVKNGWQAAHIGDGVVAGDLLISGVYENKDTKTTQYAHSNGEFKAKVNEKIDITISRTQNYKQYTKTKTVNYIYFFGIKIPLGFVFNKQSCDISTKSKYIKLNNRNMPIGIISTKYKYYQNATRQLTDSELNTMLTKQINAKIANYKEVSRDVDIAFNADNITASGTIVCIESIGVQVPIKVKSTSK